MIYQWMYGKYKVKDYRIIRDNVPDTAVSQSLIRYAEAAGLKGTCVKYLPLKKGWYALLYVSSVDCSMADARKQVFVHGYVFDEKAAGELMRDPSLTLQIQYAVTPDEIPAKEEMKPVSSWEEVEKRSDAVPLREEAERDEVLLAYYRVLLGKNRMLLQVLGKDGMKNAGEICAALRQFPEEVRKETAFSSYIGSMEEADGFKVAAVSRENYLKIKDQRFNGASAMERIIIPEDADYPVYYPEKVREQFAEWKKEKRDAAVKQEKKSLKKEETSPKWKKNKRQEKKYRPRTFLSTGALMCILLGLGILWPLQQIRVLRQEEIVQITISAQAAEGMLLYLAGVLTGMAVFLGLCCIAAFLGELRRRRKG